MLISVIVPVYKVEPYLRRCVDSVLAQTFADFELILVDDGSPDQCPAICDEYAAKDSRVKVIHQPNGGLSAARNAALDWIFTYSDSQWVFFLDSDDWLHPVTLECMLDANQKFNTNVCICGYEETSGANPKVNTANLGYSLREPEQLYVRQVVSANIACGKLFRKECFKTIRFPVGKIHEDEYTTHKILFQYPSVAIVAAPLYAYFINLQGITKSQWTPKKLDLIETLAQQCIFFEANGYNKAYQFCCRRYLSCLAKQIKIVKQEYPELKPVAQKVLARVLREYHGAADISIKDDEWIFWQVFPFFITMQHKYLCTCNYIKQFGFKATLSFVFRKILHLK